VYAILRCEHVISVGRVNTLLRECRMAAVRRSPIQKRIGWRMDYHTAVRVHVGGTWKRHPEFTAKQVLEKLGSQYPVDIRFV
jgi:hypothetical protein